MSISICNAWRCSLELKISELLEGQRRSQSVTPGNTRYMVTDGAWDTLSHNMTSSCYHIGNNRNSDEYQVTNIDAVNKRSNKNLFKTAIEKLNRKYKKHKRINDNLYEVIVIYKETEDAGTVDRIVDPNIVKSEPCRRKHIGGPAAPPRTRSRYSIISLVY